MEQNNMGSEDAAQSSAYVIFDSRGMSELDIINQFQSPEINDSYKTVENNTYDSKKFIGENVNANR
jgi:hypothetical protein